MTSRVKEVRLELHSFVTQQGFLSAAENASFDREFDAITMQLSCVDNDNWIVQNFAVCAMSGRA